LLDEELAAGIVAANRVQRRFRKDRRVDPADFSKALQRFQTDAHEVITLLNDRLSEMRSQENFEVVKNLVDRSHDMVDLAVELGQWQRRNGNSARELVHREASYGIPCQPQALTVRAGQAARNKVRADTSIGSW